MNPKSYIPRLWQLPHLLITPVGGKVLMVERASIQPPQLSGGFEWEITPSGKWFECVAVRHHEEGVDHPSAREEHLWERLGAPLGPVSTVLAIEGVGDFRTTANDLRRVDTMTPHEANLWGVKAELDRDGTDADRLIAVVTEQEAAKERYLADNPGATWGDWAWFITAERVERA